MAGRVKASDHLDGLAAALAMAGWSAQHRYGERPALLHVYSPDLPCLVGSVRVKAGTGGVPWFVCATGDPLRPCHDLTGTVAEIAARFAAADEGTERPRRRLIDRIRVFVRISR